ncbi:hypothetical protein SAMN05421821_103448 [Mucilaginibacter lappiensis]|uniref:Uncharacterized protein n=1 Tax=Mucilaginibacter lappiensis TaxID=354630 RepID=A0ABR6PHF9_9SPHI|nr:hypothetical protein [Mucilaginibacter lappiensis]SIQ80253.1 hypothetical protein SAMN05421821_103448 [Mucilaginibacter lappiensis]
MVLFFYLNKNKFIFQKVEPKLLIDTSKILKSILRYQLVKRNMAELEFPKQHWLPEITFFI